MFLRISCVGMYTYQLPLKNVTPYHRIYYVCVKIGPYTISKYSIRCIHAHLCERKMDKKRAVYFVQFFLLNLHCNLYTVRFAFVLLLCNLFNVITSISNTKCACIHTTIEIRTKIPETIVVV